MLKVEFHSHTNYVQEDETNYSPKELIDRAVKLGYDVLCVTEHYWPNSPFERFRRDPLKTYRDFKDYAEEKGLLLVPCVEFFFKEGEVLLINYTGDVKKLKRLDDLKDLPESVLKIAPHPFYGMLNCLGDDLEKNICLFDGVEFSFYYSSFFNPNKKAVDIAKRFNLPMLGTSDLHDFSWMGYTFTLVDSEKNLDSLVNAVKAGKVEVVTKPLPLHMYLYVTYFHSIRKPGKLLGKIKRELKARIL